MTATLNRLRTTGFRFASRVVTAFILLATILGQQVAYATKVPRFIDVPETHWAYAFIQRAAELGIVSGTSATTFDPDDIVTNAQMMTMVTNAFYKKSAQVAAEAFEDREWWYPFAETAYIKGVMAGTTVFVARDSEAADWDATVNAGINRYDMAQVIYNVMVAETTLTPDADAIEAAKQAISDWEAIPTNYQQAVAACYAAHIISGIDASGTFGGDLGMTRAQAATVFLRVLTGPDQTAAQ